MHVKAFTFHECYLPFMPGHVQVRVESPLIQYLGAAQRKGFVAFPVEGFPIHDIGAGVVFFFIEGAESASRHTDIRIIDVAVHGVGGRQVRVESEAGTVGQSSQGEKIRLFIQEQGLIRAQPYPP